MSHIGPKRPSFPDLVATRDEEGSSIRSRDGESEARPRQASSPELKPEPPARSTKRSHSSTRPAAGSLDDRLEKKLNLARELMKDLPSTDARVRLLHVALMRRDETLLDGVLAELNKPAPRG